MRTLLEGPDNGRAFARRRGTYGASRSLAALLSLSLLVSACGTTQSDRALSGGLLGAGTGAVIGSVLRGLTKG